MVTQVCWSLLALLFVVNFPSIQQGDLLSLARSNARSQESKEIPTVSLCEFVTYPDLYENKVVRVRATYYVNWESYGFYDSKCPDAHIDSILRCESCKAVQDRVDKQLRPDPFGGVQLDLLMVGRLKRITISGRHRKISRLGFVVDQIEEMTPVREKLQEGKKPDLE